MPFDKKAKYFEISPFNKEEMINRIELFIQSYANENKVYLYSLKEILIKVQERLLQIAVWSEEKWEETNNSELLLHAKMYRLHCDWLNNEF